MGPAARYAAIAAAALAAVAVLALLLLPAQRQAQHAGTPNGYQGFIPNGVMSYDGHQDPAGTLMLDNGTAIRDAIWDGQYANTIIQNHNQMEQLNSQWVGRTDPVNHQPYVPLQDLYVTKGQVPIQQVTINGQTYYVIDADKINPANIAGFYTYDKWVPNVVVAMNTQGTYAAVLPGNSPVFQWTNTTGTAAYQTMLYQQNNPYYFTGGYVLVLPNRTIIPYGMIKNVLSATFNNYFSPPQVYNPSS